MSIALDKAKISGIAGLFGAFAVFVYGFVNFVLIGGMATFLLTLMIQYGSIKVKILVPIVTLLALFSWSMYNGDGI